MVRRLESGGQTLEESLGLWERGEQLADICQRWLQGASDRLDAAIAQREVGPAECLIAVGTACPASPSRQVCKDDHAAADPANG